MCFGDSSDGVLTAAAADCGMVLVVETAVGVSKDYCCVAAAG